MKIDDQCASLELCKRLKELGVKQESYFYWYLFSNPIENNEKWIITTIQKDLLLCCDEYYSAFTVAELGELLPVTCKSYKLFSNKWECVYEPSEIGVREMSEANARASMLINLIEKGLIKND